MTDLWIVRGSCHHDCPDTCVWDVTATVTATLSDEVQPGLVALPFGWWHRHSVDDRGVNALTNPMVSADDVGSAAFHETLVEVARCDG